MNRADDIDLAEDGASRVDEPVLSWERRDELGLFRAAYRTVAKMLESDPICSAARCRKDCDPEPYASLTDDF